MAARSTADPAGRFAHVALRTTRGIVEARLYGPPGSHAGIIWVGGVGGDFDTPARGLYPDLAARLGAAGITSLWVRFRDLRRVEEAVHDVVVGTQYLTALGIERLILVGHSFGGAVVIRAAAIAETVVAVVALSPQAYGAEPAALLGQRVAVLLVHGLEDEVLDPGCARMIERNLSGRKRLVLLPGAGHILDEAAMEVRREVEDWILAESGTLARPADGTAHEGG
jgi:pimeloyl-ACP methyl ester carboxylesterase